MDEKHNELIVDQFTRQARPFAQKHEHKRQDMMQLLLDAMALNRQDQVLDVACGPGLTACSFAPRVSHVTGIDLTPAMLDQARATADSRNVQNVTWRHGDVEHLPFADKSFSVVFSRFAFHHFRRPTDVLAGMARVCAAGGKVVIHDVYTTSAAQQQAYDRIEKLRDPSHTCALQLSEFREMFEDAGLSLVSETPFRLEMEFNALLATSFPNPGEGEKALELMIEDIGKNTAGFLPRLDGREVWFTFPTMIFVGQKSS